jgi:hypothetical protein
VPLTVLGIALGIEKLVGRIDECADALDLADAREQWDPPDSDLRVDLLLAADGPPPDGNAVGGQRRTVHECEFTLR